ncbi:MULTISPECIES: MarR family winged helix-turn-helix transcriptional regulator [Sphingomonadaceae]|uniref:MarR family winged helix-turn-helix transcriptional regulator n=1 Tax=Sphingomonadales TaxID=204457 RepID=UPI001CCA0D4D|nr:MarR family transcriptional regulator [Sphingobium sp. 3R8]MBA4089208.1 MarR family transcriptional regulator [Sphingobium sp.]MBZ9646662.1 MarR family transcriptional regulator [Sphingobium sp. 3R8]
MHDPLAHLPGYALRRAAHVMMDDLSTRLQAIDLKLSEASVLLLIDGRDDITSSEIGRVLDIQRANMVPLLNRLDAQRLIRRRPLDRKSMAIMLTEEGQERLVRAKAITEAFEADLLARIPRQHRDHFVPALNALWMTAP